jgi:hypothetical protein
LIKIEYDRGALTFLIINKSKVRNLFRLLLLTLFLSCNSGKQMTQTSNDLMTSVVGLTFKSYFSKDKIPKGLYRNYKKNYGEDMLMAEKEGKFNPLDVQEKDMADRRFIFGANSASNSYELFVYEEGGVGLKNFCIISKKEEGVMLRAYLFRRAGSISELKEIISKKEYRISNRN